MCFEFVSFLLILSNKFFIIILLLLFTLLFLLIYYTRNIFPFLDNSILIIPFKGKENANELILWTDIFIFSPQPQGVVLGLSFDHLTLFTIWHPLNLYL